METKNKTVGKTTKLNVKPCGRFILYWHRFANSGFYEFRDFETVKRMAETFAEKENMYSVVIFDTEKKLKWVIKNDN